MPIPAIPEEPTRSREEPQDKSDQFGTLDISVLPAEHPKNDFVRRFDLEAAAASSIEEPLEISLHPWTNHRWEFAFGGRVISIGYRPAQRERAESNPELQEMPPAFIRTTYA